MTPGGPQGGYKRSHVEEVIACAVVDALILRQEMRKHDLTHAERTALMAAAMPGLIALEAERLKGGLR